MRAVVQRSGSAKCVVDNKATGQIPEGLVVLISVDPEDTDHDIDWMVNKISGLRIFPDSDDKMNVSLLELQNQWSDDPESSPGNRPGILSISQFTLHGNVRKGFRPSFVGAADPEKAAIFYSLFNDKLRARGVFVAEGIFGATMDISLVNKGPVTILIDSRLKF